MRTRVPRSKLMLLFMTFAMLLVLPVTAFADTLSDANDDLVTNAASLNLGDIEAGETKTGSVNLIVDCAGQNHAAPGALQFDPVGKALNSGSKGSTAEVSVTPSVTIPNSWPADSTKCSATTERAVGAAQVSVTAGTELGSRSVKITLTTPNTTDVSGTSNFDVTYNVVDSTPPPPVDTDGDGIADTADNCPNTANAGQADADGDGQGDVCDSDRDGDGVGNATDNCADAANANQADTDNDGVGNVCDPDSTPPVISKVVTGTLGSNGWYTSNVSVDWTVSDDESNISSQNGCNDFNVTSDQQATTYTCTATSGGGTASQSVTIKRDATDPTNVAGALNRAADHNGWYNAAVDATFSGQDATSGIASCSSDGAYSGPDGTGKSISGSCTDNAGNDASGTSTALKYDATAPDVRAVPSRAADSNGWYNHSFTVGFATSTDATSGIASCDDAVTYSGPDGTGKSISGSCTDNAGNSANDAFNFKYDATAPTIENVGVSVGTLGSNGWYTSQVTNEFSAADGLSGFAGKADPHSIFETSGTQEGRSIVLNSGTVTDLAGNVSNSANSAALKIDLSAPVVNITNAPADGATVNVCDPAGLPSPSYTAQDAISGIASDSGSFTTQPNTASAVGAYTYKAQATDYAGLSSNASLSYKVVYGGAFGGVLQPINGGATTALTDDDSRFKLGSTVPVKFRMMCGTTPIDNAVAKLNVKKADGTPGPGVDEAVSTAASTTGNLFRYDATSGQYIFNLSTKTGYTNPNGTTVSWAAGTYTLSVMLDDGSYRSVNINIVK